MMPNIILWYGVPRLLRLLCQYWEGQCWLWRMLELSSKDIPYVLKYIQICGSRKPRCRTRRHDEYSGFASQKCHMAYQNPVFLRQYQPFTTVMPNATMLIPTITHSGYIPTKDFCSIVERKTTFL
ncbi:hypothetical protein TNCV_2356421 [Trichonephila clavipes]|nr:hypothetical protein TNCV_2356421 [Trichonephila clavipes]